MGSEVRKSFILVLGTGATAGLSLVFAVYVGRVLGVADYADFSAAVSVAFLGGIALGPINGIVARFTAEYNGRGEVGKIRALHYAILKRVALGGLAVLMVASAGAYPLAKSLNFASPWLLVTACVVVYLTLLVSVSRGLLRGVQHFGSYNLNTVLEAVARLLAGAALLALAATTLVALSAYVIALLTVLILAAVQVRKLVGQHAPERLDSLAVKRFAVMMFFVMLVSAGFQNLDMLFVKRYTTAVEAGLYGAAFTFARMIPAIMTPFSVLTMPLITTLHVQRQPLARSFGRICVYFVTLAAAPLLLFYVLPDQIMRLYGAAFIGAAPLLAPLALGRLFGCLCHMVALAYASVSRFHFLPLYLGGLVMEAVVLAVWHETPAAVIRGVIVVQGTTFLGISLLLVQSYLRIRPRRNRGQSA